MATLYISAFVSFISGVFGFIIIKFWIGPIWNYRKIKKQTASEVDRYIDLSSGEQGDEETRKAAAKELRICATNLTDTLDLELPHWYRLILKNRGESPVDASKILMKLSNTTKLAHIRHQADEIRRFLQPNSPDKVSEKN